MMKIALKVEKCKENNMQACAFLQDHMKRCFDSYFILYGTFDKDSLHESINKMFADIGFVLNAKGLEYEGMHIIKEKRPTWFAYNPEDY